MTARDGRERGVESVHSKAFSAWGVSAFALASFQFLQKSQCPNPHDEVPLFSVFSIFSPHLLLDISLFGVRGAHE